MSSITVEYALNMEKEEDAEDVKNVLRSTEGVKDFTVDWEKQMVVVTSSRTSVEIADRLESLGKQVRIRGLGNQEQVNMGAGVCILQNKEIKGVVRLIQLNASRVLVEATVHGLSPGKHGIHIFQSGNIADDGAFLTKHYNPNNYKHGSPDEKECHAGDLGNLEASEDGKSNFRVESEHFIVSDVIGRAICVSEREDDLGKEPNDDSILNGNSGKPLVCGVIARSSGLFQNPKRICKCSGATIWEEDVIG